MEQLRGQDADKSHVVGARDWSNRLTAFLDQAAYRARLEIAGAGYGVGREQRFHVLVPVLEKAFAVGRPVGLLRPLDDHARQVPAERLAQQVLLAQALQLERRRQRGAELDHAVVEEREAP